MAVLATLALLVQGCAALSREECQAGDWRAIGYRDGANGYPASRLDDHSRNCRQYGAVPRRDLYLAGRQSGLVAYCRPNSGYHAGLMGWRYYGVCPANVEGRFLDAFRAGGEIHALEERISALASEIRKAESELEKVEKDLKTAQANSVSSAGGSAAQAQAVVQLQSLSEDKGRLDQTLSSLHERRARLQGRQSTLRRQYDAIYY